MMQGVSKCKCIPRIKLFNSKQLNSHRRWVSFFDRIAVPINRCSPYQSYTPSISPKINQEETKSEFAQGLLKLGLNSKQNKIILEKSSLFQEGAATPKMNFQALMSEKQFGVRYFEYVASTNDARLLSSIEASAPMNFSSRIRVKVSKKLAKVRQAQAQETPKKSPSANFIFASDLRGLSHQQINTLLRTDRQEIFQQRAEENKIQPIAPSHHKVSLAEHGISSLKRDGKCSKKIDPNFCDKKCSDPPESCGKSSRPQTEQYRSLLACIFEERATQESKKKIEGWEDEQKKIVDGGVKKYEARGGRVEKNEPSTSALSHQYLWKI